MESGGEIKCDVSHRHLVAEDACSDASGMRLPLAELIDKHEEAAHDNHTQLLPVVAEVTGSLTCAVVLETGDKPFLSSSALLTPSLPLTTECSPTNTIQKEKRPAMSSP